MFPCRVFLLHSQFRKSAKRRRLTWQRTLVHSGKIQKASFEEIESIYGVGPVVAQAVIDWFKVAANKKLVVNLLKQVKIQGATLG